MNRQPKVILFQANDKKHEEASTDHNVTALDARGIQHHEIGEYNSIFKLFDQQAFQDSDLIGIFPPEFYKATGRTGSQIIELTRKHNHPILNFSPYFDQCALYINPFEQGEIECPGLANLAAKAFRSLGFALNINEMICDRTTWIYRNHFVATYATWMEWLYHAKKLVEACNSQPPKNEGEAPTEPAEHTKRRPSICYVLDGLITVFMKENGLAAIPCLDYRSTPTALPHARSMLGQFIVLDALKGQYLRTADDAYLQHYLDARKPLLTALTPSNRGQ